MPDWNTRLAVEFSLDPSNPTNNETLISPIDTFSTTIGLVASELHSIEATRVGAVYAPRSITFTMTIKAMGDAAANLTAMAMQGQRFNVVIQVQEGTDWAFQSIVLSNCVVTSFQTNAPVSGAPTITLSGVSLKASETPFPGSTAPAVTIPF